MFKQALEDFNIDIKNSFMIGDAERDIIFGKNAGLKTIGVKTGYGIQNSKIIPDYIFDNLKDAAEYVISRDF
jgi:D-glycero-D-manno-heptose 1,7-bisphosphate phosphatase